MLKVPDPFKSNSITDYKENLKHNDLTTMFVPRKQKNK